MFLTKKILIYIKFADWVVFAAKEFFIQFVFKNYIGYHFKVLPSKLLSIEQR